MCMYGGVMNMYVKKLVYVKVGCVVSLDRHTLCMWDMVMYVIVEWMRLLWRDAGGARRATSNGVVVRL